MLEKNQKPPNLSQAAGGLCSLFTSVLKNEKELD